MFTLEIVESMFSILLITAAIIGLGVVGERIKENVAVSEADSGNHKKTA